MKILHTADWHLGRSFGGFDLLDDQRAAIAEIERIAKEERPDAIVIAGDIYDRAVPSEAAMAVFEDAIHELREVAPILAIAGNHDGAGRVGHLSRLLREAGIHIAATEFGSVPHVSLSDDAGEVRFHLMPFALPVEVRHALRAAAADDAMESAIDVRAGADDQALPPAPEQARIGTHESATRARIDTITLTPGVRHVLVGHLFTQSGVESEESESERDISVGGTAVVSPSLFKGFHYVALGHLHKPHPVGCERIRYAGSIARYSFSEESHEKSVSIVELDRHGEASVRSVPIPQRQGMRTIRGSFAEILGAVNRDELANRDFVRVHLTDTLPQFEAFRRLRAHYPNLVELRYERLDERAPVVANAARPKQDDHLAMLDGFCRDRLGDRAISVEARELAVALFSEARRADGGPDHEERPE